MQFSNTVILALVATVSELAHTAPLDSAPAEALNALEKRDNPHCTTQPPGSCNLLWTAVGQNTNDGTVTVFDHNCQKIGGGPGGRGTSVTSQLKYTVDITDALCGIQGGQDTAFLGFNYAGGHFGKNAWAHASPPDGSGNTHCQVIQAFPCPAH